MKSINGILTGLTLASLLAAAGTGFAQNVVVGQDSFSGINLTATQVQGGVMAMNATDMLSVRLLSDEQLTDFVDALDATPTILFKNLPRNQRVGTFYSLQHPNWPPLPANTSQSPVWQMKNFYLLNDVGYDYTAFSAVSLAAGPQRRMGAMSANGMSPLDFGDGGGIYTPDGSGYTAPDYGTNLWIAQTHITNSLLTGIGTNTQADVPYEIQSRTNLAQVDWQSEGFIYGSELTNWTPLSVWQGQRINLFIRLRSWVDSFNIGIPDWWQFQYFGTNGIDAYASAAGDGYSNLQKFPMGLNPTNYFNPNPPPRFFGALDITGTNVVLEWSNAPGPVINYVIQRGIPNTNTGIYAYSQIGLVSSNTTFYKDTGAVNNANAQNDIYNLTAVYPGGSLSATNTWHVWWYANYGSYGPPYGPPMPSNACAYVNSTGTNVVFSWTPPQGAPTNYIITRGTYNATNYNFQYSQIASVSTNTTSIQIIGG